MDFSGSRTKFWGILIAGWQRVCPASVCLRGDQLNSGKGFLRLCSCADARVFTT
ncbi:hypothetical protein X942_4310 [Burkholderia pseudomallei MSHR5596]|nr:hypothetical protein X942_4310 [Burkholderia pseudomallei MSHR5596]